MCMPPLTFSVSPVIQAAPGPARKQTASAMSSGRPSLPSGICPASATRCGSASDLVMSVSMKPGATMLTVMLGRALRGHFDAEHHFAFEATAWYWHFVDVVWLLLFVLVYWMV